MEQIILKRDRSARTIKIVLRDINRNRFDNYSIDQLRGHLIHLKKLWRNFANKSEILTENTESGIEQSKVWSLFDKTERNFANAKIAILSKIKQKKREQVEQQDELNDDLSVNDDGEEKNSTNENNPERDYDIQRANQYVQPGEVPMLWQMPGLKSIENTWGEFDGTLTQWQGFHDRFRIAVHENNLIPCAFKFQYLRSSFNIFKRKSSCFIGRMAANGGELL